MSYRLEIGLALLLAGAIAVAVAAANRTPKPPALDPRASTYLSGPHGSRALHEVLIRLGRRVERRRTALFTLAGDTGRRPALLVVLNPPIHLQPAELEQVVGFVNDGGAVLAAGTGGGITACAGWRLDPYRIRDDSVPVRSPDAALRLPRAARALARRTRTEGLQGLVKRRLGEADDACDALHAARPDTIIAATDGRPVVLRLRYARGGAITLAADAGWFRNQAWRETDLPYVILPLLTSPRPGRVVWDEYHQGFGREAPSVAGLTWDWLRRSPAGWAMLQALAVALVWLAATAVRFGPARSVIERRRRSPLEHLEALAAGLESAAGADTAVQRIVSGLHRRLSRTGSLTPAASFRDTRDLSSWLGGLELAMPSPRGRGAVRTLQRLVTQPGGAERALAAAQAVEDVWQELRPRSTRDAF